MNESNFRSRSRAFQNGVWSRWIFKQGIVVGTQVGWRSRAENNVTKHPADRRTIRRAAMHGKPDNPTRVLVQHNHHPMRSKDQRLTAKQVDATETVLAVTEKCQPGWTPRAGVWPAVLGQHAPHQVFVHGDIESQVHLIGNPLVAEARIPSLHLHDSCNQLGRRALWPRSSASFGRKQFPVLTLHQQPLKAQYRGGLQNDCATLYGRHLQQACA